MEHFGNKCNCYPFEEEEKVFKVSRQHTSDLDCYMHIPKTMWMNEELETSSSSSSSSSSESEEEMNLFPEMKQKKFLHRLPQEMKTTCPEWYTMVDLEGCYPEEVMAKLNTKTRILLITVKINTQTTTGSFRVPKKLMLQQGGKVIRVVPLPENIHIQKLCVKVLPTGEMIVKAPFIQSTETILRQKKILRSLPLWVPIPVIRKDTTFFNKKSQFLGQQQQQRFPKTFFPLNYTRIEDEEELLGGLGQYWGMKKMNKNWQYRDEHCYPTTSIMSKIFRPEVIRDEITGKLATLFKVNTIGFLPEEVRVRVDEQRNILIVEAVNTRVNTFTSGQLECTKEQLLQQGLPVKYFRREFILPHGVDVEHICYCVKETGLLVIKVPILNTTQRRMFSTGLEHNLIRGSENMEEMLGHIYRQWEKPMFA